MAKAILRTEKIKTHANMSSSIQHALRERETKNADLEKTPDNEIIVPFDEEKFYQDVESNRTTKFLDGPNANVICLELLLTASAEHWEGKSKEDVDKWTKENMKWVYDKFGEENVVSAVLHKDEVSPHLSVHIIPIVRDRDKQGLGCKKWTGTPQLMREMQDGYAEQMKQFGLERGERGSIADHKTVQEYYAELEKIKAETLAQNPDVKLEVKPDQLRDPSLSDRMNIDKYKAEIIKDTVDIMQTDIDKLTDQNKKLTAKLMTAENKVTKQSKELTELRTIRTKNMDDLKKYGVELKEYEELKPILQKPHIAEAIHVERNPHIGQYRELKAEKFTNDAGEPKRHSDAGIAYKMLITGTKEDKVRDAFNFDKKDTVTVDKALTLANGWIAKDNAVKAEQARIAQEQAKAQAEQAKQAELAKKAQQQALKEKQADLDMRQNETYKWLYKKLDAKYKTEGMTDQKEIDVRIACNMSHNFARKNIEKAIADNSPKAPDESEKAIAYAREITGFMDKRFNNIKKVREKGTGGGRERGGGGLKLEKTNPLIDGVMDRFLDARGAVGMRANIFRDDDREEYLEKLKSGVDVDFD